MKKDENMKICKTCDYYYKEHCCNGKGEYCTEPVSEDFSCIGWEVYNFEELLLNEIKDRRLRQIDIAKTYSFILKQNIDVDWGKINKEILKRWKQSGLDKIKRVAWSGKFDENMEVEE